MITTTDIKSLIRACNLQGQHAARIMGITHNTLIGWMARNREPHPSTLAGAWAKLVAYAEHQITEIEAEIKKS